MPDNRVKRIFTKLAKMPSALKPMSKADKDYIKEIAKRKEVIPEGKLKKSGTIKDVQKLIRKAIK